MPAKHILLFIGALIVSGGGEERRGGGAEEGDNSTTTTSTEQPAQDAQPAPVSSPCVPVKHRAKFYQ